MSGTTVIQKVLSANDLGATGSHQAGIHIPKSVREFFPPLDETLHNPDLWIEFLLADGGIQSGRFIYYNNKLTTDSGTRDEYRLTRVVPALRMMGAGVGDTIEFVLVDENTMRLRLIMPSEDIQPERVTVNVTGNWRVVRGVR
jgi:hypothetical protein